MTPSNKKPLILVTGGAGYVGSTFIRDALASGFRVRCMDIFIYGGKSIAGFVNHPDFEMIRGDIRNKPELEKALNKADAVVHLAAIVGDLPCQTAPRSAYQINFRGTQLLADLSKKNGIRHFIFASTCSNYGVADPTTLADETRDLNPVSLYAETKIDCEHYLTGLADDKFHPTCLRFGTAFGVSFRTRFDLLINSFVYEALTQNKLTVFASKTWRPYIHVADMSKIFLSVLKAEPQKVSAQIFNAGATHQNYTKEETVEMILDCLPDVQVDYVHEIEDKRNYRVDFTKIESALRFSPTKTVKDGIRELIACFRLGILTDTDYESNNLEHLQVFFNQQESILAQ